MNDTLVPLKVPPGLVRLGTTYQQQGRWRDGSLVRFRGGAIQPVGGWQRASDADGENLDALDGVPRAVLGWRDDDGAPLVAFATTQTLSVLAGGTMHDITPTGFPDGLSHTGSLVTSGATAVDATSLTLTATTLTGSAHIGDTVTISSVTYTVTATAVAASNSVTVSVTPAVASAIADGTAATYQASILVDGVFTSATGSYGDGAYGSGAYGVGPLSGSFMDADTWQLDTFGAHLAAVCTQDQRLVIWAGDVDTAAAAPTGAPTKALAVVTTPERFLFLLGTVESGGTTLNVRLVRWPSQESETDWTPSATNTAGEFELATNGALLAGRRTRGATLLWTDLDVHQASYIGGPAIYRFDQVGDQCGLIAPNAVAMVDGRALWMGARGFFAFDGYVQPVPCDVADLVFGDVNTQQRKKIWALPLAEFGEVWWFYPSAGSLEIDRYVAFSYVERHWSAGAIFRTAGTPLGPTAHPILCEDNGRTWEHEVGADHGTLTPFLESGPMELGNGDRLMRVLRVVPDERTLGDTQVTLYSAMSPTGTETTHGPFTAAQPTDVRFTARQVRIRYDEVNATDWRIGLTRLGVRPGSRR